MNGQGPKRQRLSISVAKNIRHDISEAIKIAASLLFPSTQQSKAFQSFPKIICSPFFSFFLTYSPETSTTAKCQEIDQRDLGPASGLGVIGISSADGDINGNMITERTIESTPDIAVLQSVNPKKRTRMDTDFSNFE